MKRTCLACLVVLVAAPAWAGNGHYLHGIGAVNSSVGGVATAVPFDVVGALHVNPAVLTEFDGNQVAFSVELFSDQPEATASFAASGQSFTTEASTELGVLPAIAFSHRLKNRPITIGFGLLAIAGFRTDWPQDPNNPIFAPQPDGFGTVKTNLAITKIPFALAYEVNPKLSVGFALDFYAGTLAISPLPPGAPQCTNPAPGSGRVVDCWFSDADNTVPAYALGAHLGLYYKVSPKLAVGLSYSSAPDFNDYEWNSSWAMPYHRLADGTIVLNVDANVPNNNNGPNQQCPAPFTDSDGDGRCDTFGRHRTVKYPLDGQAIVAVGVGFTPNDKLRIGIDGRWYGYSSVDGAGHVGGFRTDRGLNEIGWDDILIGAIGVTYQASEKLTVRGGFNYSETPIQERKAFTSLGTPPTFEQHYTFGLGYQLTEKIQLNLAAYYVPENSVTGPLLSPFLAGDLNTGPGTLDVNDDQIVPGGFFTISERLVSGLVSLSYSF